MSDQVAASSSTTQRTGEFTGWHMLTLMLLFFGVIVAVNITMAVMAGRTWTGLVVKNSYVESQKFNGYLAAARAQDAKGWRTRLTYSNSKVVFLIEDRTGKPVRLDNPSLYYGRPAFEQADQTIPLVAAGHGRYTADVKLQAGPWVLRVAGTSDGQPYRRDSRLHVSASDLVGREDPN